MFQKLMIANRGEIACRIIRTAKKLGIKTLAIYSDSDRESLHVSQADEAYCVGEAEPSKSYLNIKKILKIAVDNKVDSIHPGYGFLSENHIFAKKIESMGIIFIGPGWEASRTMGNKKNAKKAVSKARIPFVPGFEAQKNDLSDSLKQAKIIGYPLLIKAAAGGGGKGMKIVSSESDLGNAIQSVKREALSSFGNSEIIIEKYIQGGKHIEIQVASDKFGNTVHLLERDCSTQRRYQKVIEECPAKSIPDTTKEKMFSAAVSIAKAIKYVNLGTIEFIVDISEGGEDLPFYFLEMNTRLQVEHPVTEYVLGIDLVELQLKIAASEKLPFSQIDIRAEGHSVEARIYAEDPKKNFLPSTGKIQKMVVPQDIRLDFGVRVGDVVESYYDPMLGKVIVHGKNRQVANQKMREALKELKMEGIQTNIEFLYKIMHNPLFINNNMQVDNLQLIAEQFTKDEVSFEHIISASIVYMFLDSKFEKKMWRIWGEGQSDLGILLNEMALQIKVINSGDTFTFNWEQNSYITSDIKIRDTNVSFSIGANTYDYHFEFQNEWVRVFDNGSIYDFSRLESSFDKNKEEIKEGRIVAPITGKVVKILTKKGQVVSSGASLVIIEAMKMEYELKATKNGKVKDMKIKPNQIINKGDLLLEIS